MQTYTHMYIKEVESIIYYLPIFCFHRENKVRLYRHYRTGELPDIEISRSALVYPLQALCLVDSETAKIGKREQSFKCADIFLNHSSFAHVFFLK